MTYNTTGHQYELVWTQYTQVSGCHSTSISTSTWTGYRYGCSGTYHCSAIFNYLLLPFYKQSKSYLALLQVIFLGGRFYRSVRLRINCRIWIRSICLYRKYRNKSKKDDKNHKNVKIVEDLVLCKVFNYNGLTLKFVQWF